MLASPFCCLCKHIGNQYLPNSQDIPCKAYPNGIPNEIYLAFKLHNKVLSNQEREYIFTPKVGYENYVPKIKVPENDDTPSLKVSLPEMMKKLRDLREKKETDE